MRLIGVCFILMLLSGTVTRAAQDGYSSVTITCEAAEVLAGVKVTALRWDSQLKGLRPTKVEATFDAQGRTEITLPRGAYELEVLAAHDDGLIVALRSDRFRVPGTAAVRLRAAVAQPLSMTHQTTAMDVEQVAVRSGAVVGEIRWRRGDTVAAPRLVLTPGENYWLNVIGRASPIHVAGWVEVTGGKLAALRTASSWNECRFTWRDRTPGIREATATLIFPDTQMQASITDATRIITNRDWCALAYAVTLESGPRLQFRPNGYLLSSDHLFELGGELTPYMWAGYVLRHIADGRVPHLAFRVGLKDEGGHVVDIHPKEAGVTWSVRGRDGSLVQEGAVDAAFQDAMGDLTKALHGRLDWQWAGAQSVEVAPVSSVEVRSDHFRIPAVPFWEWRTRIYLTKLERYRQIERQLTARPGPASTKVNWRSNTHNAKAQVGSADGGGKWLWLSMPFQGYEGNWDAFDKPWFMAHEMLHTFGYHHGDEMGRLQDEVELRYAAYRWWLVEHPKMAIPLERAIPYRGE